MMIMLVMYGNMKLLEFIIKKSITSTHIYQQAISLQS